MAREHGQGEQRKEKAMGEKDHVWLGDAASKCPGSYVRERQTVITLGEQRTDPEHAGQRDKDPLTGRKEREKCDDKEGSPGHLLKAEDVRGWL